MSIFNYNNILDSERSDECIDFTIICVFFLFCVLATFWVVKMLRFSNRKVNSVGNFRGVEMKNSK